MTKQGHDVKKFAGLSADRVFTTFTGDAYNADADLLSV
jgi:hypothetical protein